MNEHDAYREQRKSSLYWLRSSVEELDILDLVESIMPTFIRRRYRFTSLSRTMRGRETSGSISLMPAKVEDSVEAADALHADVKKLFGYLALKCGAGSPASSDLRPPDRTLSMGGLVGYEFTLCGLPGFEAGLWVTIQGLPAGSACHITKTLKGTREIEDFEYTMVCDDEPVEEEVPA